MNLIIFGATGMVGKQLVKQALYIGHHVKAYGRNVFTENLPEHKELELVQGALFDEKQVLKAIKGCHAVLSALGGSFDGTDVTRSLGMKNIVAQLQLEAGQSAQGRRNRRIKRSVFPLTAGSNTSLL